MSRRLTSVLLLSFALACGEDRAPTPNTPRPDVSVPDLGFLPDTGVDTPDTGVAPDATVFPDAAEPDAAAPDATQVDTGPADAGVVVDTGMPDTGVDMTDATTPDVGPPADTGPADTGVVGPPDADNDGISDQDEGNGVIDADADGIPDSMDPDSDNDGIPDADEAGDNDPTTPPRDSDGDGTPDFRDRDSDNDTVPDQTEGAGDFDNDGTPNHLDTDADGDGILDGDDGTGDPDNDGQPNFLDRDSDNDTIRDDHDGTADADNDGTPNYLDTDADGDNLLDADEAGDTNVDTPPRDTDFDTTPNFLDLDSDNDLISDLHETLADPDGDGFGNALDIDSDNDSILDNVEAGDMDLMTAPLDTDNDTMPDFVDLDSDGDTIQDISEGVADTDGDMTPDRLDLDSDNDTWLDADEAGDADPITPPIDTDGDRQRDFRDLDSDGDTLADAQELGCMANSTERLLEDSDGDSFIDPAEVAFMTDPCAATSVIDDFFFVLPPNGPGDAAPLAFTETAIDRADFVINVDTTGSMDGEINNIRTTLQSTIIPSVDMVIPDAAFGVSSFDDFPIEPFGFPQTGDVPFLLGTRVTTDPMVAQAAVNGLSTQNPGSGADFPESGMEALFQIATGTGVTYPGGSVAPFNPNQNSVPNVSDGTIGGVGYRNDSLPVVVHVTDAIAHTRRDYVAVNPAIQAADTPAVRTALDSIGARVVTISSGIRPFNDIVCRGQTTTFFGAVAPQGMDVDWFELNAQVGDTVQVEVLAQRVGSTLNTRVAIANSTAIIAENDDIDANNSDSMVTAQLTGAGPFYVAITESMDVAFTGAAGQGEGHYLLNVAINGAGVLPNPTGCRAEDGNTRATATALVPFAQTQVPMNFNQCTGQCEMILGGFSPLFEDFTFPYEMSEDTRAVIPPCAWSEFGTRPAGCAVNQCCTGQSGVGVAPNGAGMCPLSFEIDDTGVGIDQAMVAGIEALVRFSTFDLSTRVRPDPVEMMRTGLDTTCFIHGVIPTGATPPNACAPIPTPADLFPPSPELDSFTNVVPGTALTFQVNALNQNQGTMVPCVDSTNQPQLFRAFIDVVADQVTVVDTRDVVIIVPPRPPGGTN